MRKALVSISAVALLAGCSSLPSWLGGTPASAPAPVVAEPAPAPAPAPAAMAIQHHPVGTHGMKALQHALAAKGYYHGKIDGVDGAQTKAAVARYQQDSGIQPVTGEADDQTWSSLGLSEGK
jgi:peptidoglycan hydrolase-like protein with peptidoglycan-binding domain